MEGVREGFTWYWDLGAMNDNFLVLRPAVVCSVGGRRRALRRHLLWESRWGLAGCSTPLRPPLLPLNCLLAAP